MNTLFEKSTIQNISLKNRLVRSATYDGMAENPAECRKTRSLFIKHSHRAAWA